MPDQDRAPLIAFGGMILLTTVAMLLAGAPAELMLGIVWIGFGCLLVGCPPRFAVRRRWLGCGLALIAGCSLAFLPHSWFGVSAWRSGLEALGLPLPATVTLRPGMSGGILAQLAVSVLAAWYLLGHRISEKRHRWLVLGIAAGIAVYGVACMMVFRAKVPWVWDPEVTFGLYPNRNHTATVLVMGALCSMGLILEGARSRHGALAGIASLCLAICAFGLLGFSVSRAGVLFLFAGSLAWFLGLGSGFLTRRILVTVILFAAVIGTIFWMGNTGLRERIESQLSRLQTPAAGAAADSGDGDNAAVESAGLPFDFRVLIYRDTWDMLRSEPVTGVGLGQFGTVFPQYRNHSMIEARCVHPESSWLMLAAEGGMLTMAVTAAGAGMLFFTAFRQARRRHRGWPVILATLVAALTVPLHGVFDVPAHHVGLTWTALLLVALSFRAGDEGTAEARAVSRRIFQAAGVAVVCGGLWMGSRWLGTQERETSGTAAAIESVKAHYARDVAEKNDPANHPPETGPDGQPLDQLEVAQEVLKPALAADPLETELHYLRGMLSVNFRDETEIADQAFATQRLLIPDRVEPPYRQGLAWMDIDPRRTLKLWEEAFRRSIRAAGMRPGAYWSPETLMKKITAAAQGKPALEEVIRRLAEEFPAASPPAPAPPAASVP